MTEKEVREKYRQQTEMLTTMRVDNDEQSMPAVVLATELAKMVEALKNENGTFRKNAVVEKSLTDESLLIFALTAPTQFSWCEDTDETERDPVSGNLRPKKAWHSKGTSLSPILNDIKQNLVACARVMTAYAKFIASSTYGEWHDIYFTLEAYAAKNGLLIPFDEDFAHEIVSRFSDALFALWVDNEIEREVRHV